MDYQISYLHCGEPLKASLKTEIDEVIHVVDLINWEDELTIHGVRTKRHQEAYNERFKIEFEKTGMANPALFVSEAQFNWGFSKELGIHRSPIW